MGIYLYSPWSEDDRQSDERFNLTSQIRRAVDSISLNIAEESTSQSNAEFKKLLGYSLRSTVEVVSAMYIAKRGKYVTGQNFNLIYSSCEELVKMIQGLKKSLN